MEEEIMDEDEDGDEVKSESTREEGAMEDIEVKSYLKDDETVQEEHEPLVEGEEDKPTREENQEENEDLSVEPRETIVEPGGEEKHVQEDHEEFFVELREKDSEESGDDKNVNENLERPSVEPRKQEDEGIKDVFENIQVEMKDKGGEKDAKDGNECLFGEEENQET